MIQSSDLTHVGKVNKTHGVNGEMSISFFEEGIDQILDVNLCLLFDLDGIYTPFYISSVRPRSAEAWLISLDGVPTQENANFFVGRDVFVLTKELPEIDADEEDGFYASDLIGYQVQSLDGQKLGIIIDIDDSTANALFIIENPEGQIIYIPIADEFISEISDTKKLLIFDLPEGLLSI